jgi:hypothetical protein
LIPVSHASQVASDVAVHSSTIRIPAPHELQGVHWLLPSSTEKVPLAHGAQTVSDDAVHAAARYVPGAQTEHVVHPAPLTDHVDPASQRVHTRSEVAVHAVVSALPSWHGALQALQAPSVAPGVVLKKPTLHSSNSVSVVTVQARLISNPAPLSDVGGTVLHAVHVPPSVEKVSPAAQGVHTRSALDVHAEVVSSPALQAHEHIVQVWDAASRK